MKVCILTPSYPRYENDTSSPFVHEFVKALVRQNIKVHVVSSEDAKIKGANVLYKKIRVSRFTYFFPRKLQRLTYFPGGIPEQFKTLLGKIQLPFFLLSFFFKSLKAAKDCDVIHAHWTLSGVIGIILKKIYRKPVILTIRENNVGIVTGNFLFRYVIKKSDLVVVNNDVYFNEIKKIIQQSKLVKIYNGVYSKFKPMDKMKCRKKINIPADKKVILFSGYIIKRKGADYLFDVALELVKKRNDLLFIFIGEGELKKQFVEKVNKSKLSDKILLVGKKPFDQMPLWYNSSDIFVLPTLADGIPNVLKEAMSCGLPAISTSVGGIPEVIKDSVNGFIVPRKDTKILKSRILNLVKSGEKRKRFGKYAKKVLVEKGIDWDVSAKRYIKLYTKIFKYK